MITLSINGSTQRDSDITSQWIKEQVLNRQKDGQNICVVFEVECPGINLNFSLGNCPKGTGGPRRPYKKREDDLIKAWGKYGFKDRKLNVGVVNSAWKFLQKACR